MFDADYTHTRGLTEAELRERITGAGTGVLALAEGDDAYAVPLSHAVEEDRLLFRLGTAPESRLRRTVETTASACYVCYDTEPTDDPRGIDSWSVLVEGPIAVLSDAERDGYDPADLNRLFEPVRVFDEAIEEMTVELAVMDLDGASGRATVDAEA